MEQLILGMLAPVDAGKTSLTESMLFETGIVAELGRVDHGTAFLDTESMEKSRGITIYSKEARFSWGGWEITLWILLVTLIFPLKCSVVFRWWTMGYW